MFQLEVVLLYMEKRVTGWKGLALIGCPMSARFASPPKMMSTYIRIIEKLMKKDQIWPLFMSLLVSMGCHISARSALQWWVQHKEMLNFAKGLFLLKAETRLNEMPWRQLDSLTSAIFILIYKIPMLTMFRIYKKILLYIIYIYSTIYNIYITYM